MRKVVASAFVSIDGVMQAPGGPEEDTTSNFRYGGWTVPYFDDAVGQAMDKVLAAPFDLLLGRKTYDIFASHWPYVEGTDADGGIAGPFNEATKYVATTSSKPLTWKNSVALRDAAAEVVRLKKGNGPNLLIQGSSELVQTLLANDLIDEITLLVFPLVLGPGKKFFAGGTRAGEFELAETKVSATGVIINRYVRSGDVKTGSFALENPTAAEVKRREEMNARR